VRLDVLLQVLGTLEGFAAEVALVRLQGDVDSDVGSDVVALNGRSATVAPLTRKVEVVGALAADMALTNMVLKILSASGVETKAILGRVEQDGMHTYIEEFGAVTSFATALPLACKVVDGRAGVLHGLHGR
jgi:hypothetical protein